MGRMVGALPQLRGSKRAPSWDWVSVLITGGLLPGWATVANTFGIPCHTSTVHLWFQLLGQFFGLLSARGLQVSPSAAGRFWEVSVPFQRSRWVKPLLRG